MSYIGREPQVGNFQVCDAISVVNGQAAYTMQVGGVNVSPETVNHMLVSLNGVLQAPGSSYTVSGSTITFASNLVTGDVIDFIHILGSVLDLGVPSDSTVTNAKTNFVSTSSAAGLQIKGDGTTDGTLQLNCSQNSHGIKLKSPPHSASASYTLTFPNNDGDANQVLTTNGSGVLSFADAGGGLTLIKTQTVSSNVSSVDFVNGTGGCVIDSTYEYYIVRFSGVRFNAIGGLAGRLGTSGGFISASDYHQNEAVLLSNGNAWVLNQEETKNSFRVSDRRYTETTSGFSVNGEVRFYNMSSTSLYKAYWMEAVGFGNSASEVSYIVGSGMLEDSTSLGAANDRIQFLPLSASSIASGSFTLYGVKK